MKKLTQERLKELFNYNPETGVFTRIKAVGRHGRHNVGTIPGGPTGDGYIRMNVDHVSYKAHRLAYLYIHGYFPENDIDHIDKNKLNNAISNLREVTRQCNMRNTYNMNNNTSGIKGVYRNKMLRKWEARIGVMGKTIYIGVYKDFDNAVCARLAFEQCLGWSGCDSDSPAYKYVQKNIIRKGE